MLGDHFEAFNPIEKFGEKCLPEDYNNKYSDATNKQYMVCDYTKRNILEI